jgi:photosystem II stability/assembly factor-like uncharacterized protein
MIAHRISKERSGLATFAIVLCSLSACVRAPQESPETAPRTQLLPATTVATEPPRSAAAGSPPIRSIPMPARPSAPSLYVASGLTPLLPLCDGAATSGILYENAEVEPFVAVNPLNPQILVGTWQQDRWSNGSARALLAATSTDGGRSWSRQPLPFSRCGGGSVLNGGDYARASDPWVTHSPNGVVHAMSLSTNGGVFQAGSANAMLVSRSFDHGRSWSNPITLIRDGAAAFNDKNALTADPNDANYVYAVWDRLIDANDSGPAYFARTTDGGASWEPARPIHDPGSRNQTIGNQIAVLPNGTAINVFNQIDRPTLGPQRSRVGIVRSFDRGATWSAPIYVADLLAVGTRDPESGANIREGSIIPSIAASPLGDVYVVWQDARFSGGAFDAIALSRSIDNGTTWSAPIRVNALANVPAFTPSVHVNRHGVLGVSYYDIRNNTSTLPLTTDAWLARSGDGGATWTEQRIGASFDLLGAPNANGFFVGDYQGLASSDGVFIAFFGRVNTGDVDNRTDIVSAPMPYLPEVRASAATASAKQAALRRRGAPSGFKIGPQLRQRVDANLRRRLREPPAPGVEPRVLPHYAFASLVQR